MTNFSTSLQVVLDLAQYQAEEDGREMVETGDILMVLARRTGSIAGQYLQQRGISSEDIRQAIQGQSEEIVFGPIVQSAFGPDSRFKGV